MEIDNQKYLNALTDQEIRQIVAHNIDSDPVISNAIKLKASGKLKDIEPKSLSEISQFNYVIPSYQRGYRWEERQVEDLLNDVFNFMENTKENEKRSNLWYCLQPLVVMKKGEKYIVIDGQQRLTTISIILKILKEDNNAGFSIEYESRPKSQDFLKDILKEKKATNIDFYYMLQAKKVAEEWINKKLHGSKQDFISVLENRCKFIWYSIEKSSNDSNASDYEAFKTLNSMSVGLSNAELIKALVISLYENNTAKMLQISTKWDIMERSLRDEDFWNFVCPDSVSRKYNATHMDFIFEMIARSGISKYIKFESDYDKAIQSNEYYTFNTFADFIRDNKDNQDEIWKAIEDVYRIINNWYNNNKLYHLIGFLMNMKTSNKNKYDLLADLINICSTTDKEEFVNRCIKKCKKKIGVDINEEELKKLAYPGDNDKSRIMNILLLFNIATVSSQSEEARFPFRLHSADNGQWTLEHIHARNEKDLKIDKDNIDIIKLTIHNAANISTNLNNDERKKNLAFVNEVEEKFKNGGKFNNTKPEDREEEDKFQKKLNLAITGYSVDRYKESDSLLDWYQTSIMNLALLQGNKNSSLNNKFYPFKKQIIASWTEVQKGPKSTDTGHINYVPPCTINAFFKHYNPKSVNSLVWTKEDGKCYLKAMISTINNFLNINKQEA